MNEVQAKYYQWSLTLKRDRCPFCDTVPMVYPTDPDKEGAAWGEVRCENAKCPAKPVVRDGISSDDPRGPGAYICDAVRRWNTRAPVRCDVCGLPVGDGCLCDRD